MIVEYQTKLIRGVVGDSVYAFIRLSNAINPIYEWRLNGVVVGHNSHIFEFVLTQPMFGMDLTCTITDGLDVIDITPIQIIKAVEYDLERLNLYPPNITDYDTVLLSLREKHPFNVDFTTIDDTEEARTGFESKGVKFRDSSQSSEDDAVFILDNGIVVDADFNFLLGD